MTYRVIQWATGGVGRAAIEGVLGHPDLELAGCWVHSAAKAGQDVGTLVGREPIGDGAPNGARLSVISQVTAPARHAARNQPRADSTRPCTSWPRPGKNRLQIAAMTLPAASQIRVES